MPEPKTAILLLNMGGPDSLETVKPFLYNLFSDPDIIRLPFSILFQKPLAWKISTDREHEAQKNYAEMGGCSPILGFTQAQGDAVKDLLKVQGHGDFPVYIAMRYWHPFTEDTVKQMIQDGIERVIAVPMYPHFSYTTIGSSVNELRRVVERLQYQGEICLVPTYYNQPLYQQAVAETIQAGLQQHCWSCPLEEVRLLFTAHSLPQKHVKRTKDPYPDQVYETAKTIAQNYFSNNPWDLSYQSQVGKMPWLGPSTDGILHYYSGKRMDNILMVAISFVSDHVETLVEVDKLYLPMAKELEIEHCHRAPALNTNATFIAALADQVMKAIQEPQFSSLDPKQLAMMR